MDPTTAIIHLTREKLLRNVVQSGLVNEPDVNRFAAQHADLDMLALGQRFVSAGLLTNYQLELICQGLVAELKVGNYEILDRLGGGGMGTVYKARHRRMKRIVALKVLLSKYCRDEAFVARFQREVETIAKLGHPNIVMAYDADESEAGHFLVMEFVEGRDLASLVQKKGPLDVATAIDFVRQTALGLAYAHSMNVIHRDIKPANLLCDKYRTVKITDLGLARISAETDQSTEGTGITQIGFALGTPDFMPPEQALDPQSLDHRADIYSLGATLFYLLTGRVMYPGPSVMAVLLQHRDSPLPSIVDFRPDVPHELDAVFHKMVHKHPHDRFASMAEVVGALDAIPAFISLPMATSSLPPPPPMPRVSLQPQASQRRSASSSSNARGSNSRSSADTSKPKGSPTPPPRPTAPKLSKSPPPSSPTPSSARSRWKTCQVST
jgi:serine/threonine-protein kinase